MMTGSAQPSVWSVTGPGPLRDGLRTLLSSIQGIVITGEMTDVSAALEQGDRCPPDLIVLDADLPGGQAWQALSAIKGRWPQVHCLVLADDGYQAQRARTVHADTVLQKGMPASALIETIEAVLGWGQ